MYLKLDRRDAWRQRQYVERTVVVNSRTQQQVGSNVKATVYVL